MVCSTITIEHENYVNGLNSVQISTQIDNAGSTIVKTTNVVFYWVPETIESMTRHFEAVPWWLVVSQHFILTLPYMSLLNVFSINMIAWRGIKFPTVLLYFAQVHDFWTCMSILASDFRNIWVWDSEYVSMVITMVKENSSSWWRRNSLI